MSGAERAPVRALNLVMLVIDDYDEAIAYYVETLGFVLREDRAEPDKRWVVVSPGESGPGLVLGRARGEQQRARIGDQTGGRVSFFLQTDDFWRDYRLYQSRGVSFVREPSEAEYGTVAVFADRYGNLWDLVQPR